MISWNTGIAASTVYAVLRRTGQGRLSDLDREVEALHDKQFDLISIDRPLGGDTENYTRIDVLGLRSGCLGLSFLIMIDDCERAAESRTLSEMQNACLTPASTIEAAVTWETRIWDSCARRILRSCVRCNRRSP